MPTNVSYDALIAARNAGYSDAEILDHIGGAQVASARKAGYPDKDIVEHLSRTTAPAYLKQDRSLAGVPRKAAPPKPIEEGAFGIKSDNYLGRAFIKTHQSLAGIGSGIARVVAAPLEGTEAGRAISAKADRVDRFTGAPVAGATEWKDIKGPGSFGTWVAEELPGSLASMPAMASPVGWVALGTGTAGNIAQSRAQADGRDHASLGDVGVAAPFAVASTALDRFGFEKVIGASGGTIATRLGKAMLGEGLTETAQGGIENVGGSVGTEAGFDPKQAGLEMLQSGILGAAGGGAMHGGVEAVTGGRGYGAPTPAPAPIVEPLGLRAEAAATVPLTPQDIASPIPTDLIAQGKAAVVDASASASADTILKGAGLPGVGKRVQIDLPGGVSHMGTIADAFETDVGDLGKVGGINVALDDGTSFTEHFPTLADTGVRISELARPQTKPAGTVAANAPKAEGSDGFDMARYMGRNRSAESGGNDRAAAATSSAYGRYQFTKGTWLGTYKQAFGETGESAEQILAKRADGDAQDKLMERLTSANTAALSKAGVPITDGTAYLAHFLGARDAIRVLQADPGASVDGLVDADSLAANRSVFAKAGTAGDLLAWANRKMGSKGGSAGGSGSAAATDTGTPDAPAPFKTELEFAPDREQRAAIDDQAAQVADPTDAQKEAGNYRKGHVRLQGMDITIETPRGGTRSGTDPSGKAWSVDMPDHYGYVKRTKGADGEQVDVYVGQQPESPTVYLVDQYDADTGAFDEHKAMLGYTSADEAMSAYDAAFNDGRGPERRGEVTEMSVPDFRAWLDKEQTAPAAETVAPAAPASDPAMADEVGTGAAAPASSVVIEDMPSGKSIIVRGLDNSAESEAKVRKGMPAQGKPLWNAKEGGWVVSKKHAEKLRAAFADETRSAEAEARKSMRRPLAGKAPSNLDEAYETLRQMERADRIDEYDSSRNHASHVLGILKERGQAEASRLAAMTLDGKQRLNDNERRAFEIVRDATPGTTATKIEAPAAAESTTPAPQKTAASKPSEVAESTSPESKSSPSKADLAKFDLQFPSSREKEYRVTSDAGTNRLARPTQGENLQSVRREVLNQARKLGQYDEQYDAIMAWDGTPATFGGVSIDYGTVEDLDAKGKPKPPTSPDGGERAYGTANKVFTADAAEKARALLRSKMNQLNSGFDPEIAQAGLTLMGYHIEAGARSFIDAARAVATDLGVTPTDLRRSLRSWYNSARDWMEDNDVDVRGMDDDAAVKVDLSRIAQWGSSVETSTQEGVTNDDHADAKPERIEGNDRDRDGKRGTEGVLAGEGDRETGRDPEQPGGSGNADVPADDRSGTAANRDDERPAGADAGKPSRAKRGAGNRTQPGDRVLARGKPKRADGSVDYVAPVGSLKRDGGWKTTAARNLDIIELVNRLDSERRPATPEEQALLAKFTGWGAGEIRNNLFRPENIKRGEDGKRMIVPARWGDWKDLSERASKLLTGDALETALQSTQYAHYTSEAVIRSIWQGVERLGFAGGKILEPGMGSGLFAVAAPESTMRASSYTGIELDGFTAKVASYLLPQEAVIAGDYTSQKFPDGFFDLAIGNPPFAQVAVTNDPAYRRHRFSLHDYFFAKTIDKVRPGGLLVFVTSRYTMDKLDPKARDYITARADLIGAIRLPQTAFKENAGTEVVTDVLFLQRRAAGTAPTGKGWATVEPIPSGPAQGLNINSYYLEHPEMVLGSHATEGSQYRAKEYTVLPGDGDIESAFAAAVSRLPQNVFVAAAPIEKVAAQAKTLEADMRPAADKEGAVYLKDGHLYVRDNGVGRALSDLQKLSVKDTAWLRDYVPLRDAVKQAQRDQLHDGDWKKSLAALNTVYDAFVKKHGQVSAFTSSERTIENGEGEKETRVYKRFTNRKRLEMDVESTLVEALEKITDDGKVTKGPFLLDRTLKKPTRPEVTSAHDAVAVTLDEIGRFDLDYVADLLGKTRADIILELGDEIFEQADGGWLMADEYLSGDVVSKMDEAQVAAQADPRFERNVEALSKVLPKPLAYSDIMVRAGAGWIEPHVYEQFAREVLAEDLTGITYEPAIGAWTIPDATRRNGRSSSSEWATEDRSARELLDAVMNNRTIKVTRQDSDKKTYTDQEATALANERARKIGDKFKSWIWTDAERAQRLSAKYNRLYNNLAPRKFDGSHLTFPGLSTRYKLYDHQRRAIWRVVATGNTYLNHAVGAGKTLEMIVSGMEQKRLGLINKPMYVVPNHMLNQFAREFLDAYPAANIMVADESAFHTGNRRRFMAQAALNDPDAIIISHSSFGKIAASKEARTAVVDRFVSELEAAIAAIPGDNRIGRSKIEKQIETLKRRFEGKAGDEGKDKAITFEEMGVDYLYLDEAHEFRKLDFATNRTAVKGIDANGSQRALDLYIKLLWLNEQRPGRAATLASGTPITNTMAEIYTVMRYMDQAGLERDGIGAFDAWAAMFGEVVPGFEQNAAGGYEIVERFSKFVNVPELMKRVRTFMDVLTSDQLGALVKRPAVRGGVPENVVVEASDALDEYMKVALKQRIEKSRLWKPSKDQPGNPDPLINIITDGRLSAIDMRFVTASAVSDPESKLNKMIDNIIAKHREYEGVEFIDPATGKPFPRKGATQIIFSAVGFGEMVAASRGFDARAWVEARLAEEGIPKGAFAWMSDQKTHAKKEATFKAMRNGETAGLIGSPKNMGTGVNVQARLKVLHYLSPPWYPSDVEQPHGRIVRQGNMNEEVELYWYATKGTYDSTAWSMVSRKQRFIEQAMRGDDTIRAIEDISEANQYEMASALAAGDERAIQLSGLSNDIERLTRLRSAHADEQNNLDYRLKMLDRHIERLGVEAAQYAAAIEARGPIKPFSVLVGKNAFDKMKEAGEAMLDIADSAITSHKPGGPSRVELGRFQGELPVLALLERSKLDGRLTVFATLVVKVGPLELTIYDDLRSVERIDAVGFSQRIANAVSRLEAEKTKAEQQLEQAKREVSQGSRKLGTPFEYEGELAEKVSERARIEGDLASETAAAEKARVERAKVQESRTEVAAGASTLTERQQAILAAAQDMLDERLREMGLAAKVKVNMLAGISEQVQGRYWPGSRLIEVALNAPDGIRYVLDHEAVHAMRGMGLFSRTDWNLLVNAARRAPGLMASIDARYADADPALREEEAVADLFAMHRRGDFKGSGLVDRIIARVADFLSALRSALASAGFTSLRSWQEVFSDMGSGQLSRGPRTVPADPDEMLAGAAFASRESRPTGDVTFADPETEQRYRDATEGIGTTRSLRERVSEGWEQAWHGITRHWIDLPNEARFAELQQKLRAIESAPQHARERTVRMLDDMVKDFTNADLDLFTRKVILDDLFWDAAQDRDLPFGFTPGSLLAEKQKIDALVTANVNPKVWTAVMKRKVINRQIAQELVDVGVLEAEQIKNPAYYRHQVLEYARAQMKMAGTGSKLKTPKWAKRMGSTLDINANLLEAEFDWLNKALIDIPVATTIEWIKQSEHNLLDSLRTEARDSNKAGVDEKLAEAHDMLDAPDRHGQDELDAATRLINEDKSFRRGIAMGFARVRDALKDGLIDVPKQYAKAAAAIEAESGDTANPPFNFLAWMLDNDAEGSMGAAMILKAVGQRRAWTKALLGRDYIEADNAEELVKRLAPEGYRTWQPDEGKLLFTVKTLPEHVMDTMLEKLDAPEGVDPVEFRAMLEKSRNALALGGSKYTMILPVEVADTLSHLRRDEVSSFYDHLVREPLRWWKRWVLINPRRVIKYNLNNLSGDLDAVIAGNPRLLRHVPQAARELAGVMRGTTKPTERYEQAVARGVFDSGLSVQEIPDLHKLDAFERFAKNPTVLNKVTMLPLRKAWAALQGVTQWRENVFRYAAYLDYVARLEGGESQASVGYGASLRQMVDAVPDLQDRAALLARDLLGDYGAISHYGANLRESVLPFFSWMEINTKRYWRLTSNAFGEGILKGVQTGGGLAIVKGARLTAWGAIRMAMIYGLMTMWNHLLWPDEEDELDEMQQQQMHVILGRNDGGEIITLRLQGSFSDALGWFGLGDMGRAMHEYELGRGSLADVIAAPFKASINKVGTSLSPVITIPMEAATGKKLWPDVFNTRANRDPWRNLLGTFSLDNEYDALMAKPSRGYDRSWQEAVVYRRDPGEIAYNSARGIAYDWLAREKGQEFAGGFKSDRAEAARDYRTAVKFGDDDAAEKALQEMAALGVTSKDFKGMIKRAAPLAPIAKKDRKAFVDQMTDEEFETFQRAQAWYEKTFLGS